MQRKKRREIADRICHKLRRAALLGTLCISIAAFMPQTSHAQSQIPADTTPTGGVISAGSASIGQSPGMTTITQNSQRAAINWQSYNVGSAATVQYKQPSSTAAALNVVVTPSPSIIAGSIKANGQIVIVNQSGVLFTRGSEVSAQSVIATASNLSVPAFMAGRLVSTEGPRPGAKIINDGVITAGQTGLVGLIAPQVANNGLIVAELGQVVLAGADAFTLDLYGDQLISLDVTKSVQAVDVGGKLVPALVTNRGIILANGGKVTLTAQDADALVTQLVDAGGAILADTANGQTGSIAISGIGGDIKISGVLLAAGLASGTKGGTIQAVTTGKVSVASSAIIVSSGAAGGGVIALGTDAIRARSGPADTTAPQAASVTIAPGAQVLSDALKSGDGGIVAVVSSDDTSAMGNISAQGGTDGGNGGSVEIASGNGFSLSGSVSDAAPLGQGGKVLLEAPTLIVGDNVSPDVLDGLSGTIELNAGTMISVIDPLSISNANVSLVSGGDVSISSQVDVASSLNIDAKNSLAIDGGLNASEISLDGGNIAIDAPIDPLGVLSLTSNGSIIESGGGVIDAGTLTGTALGNVVLEDAGNDIPTLGSFTAANFSLVDSKTLNVAGPLQASDVSLSAPMIDFEGDLTAADLSLESLGSIRQDGGTITAGTLSGTAADNVTLDQSGNEITTLGSFTSTDFSLANAELLNVAGPLSATDVSLSADGIDFKGDATATDLSLASLGSIRQDSGTITAGTLTGTAADNVTLDQGGNDINTLGSFSSADFSLADAELLDVAGPVSATDVSLSADGIDFKGDATAADLSLESLGSITQDSGTITAGTLTGTAAQNVTLDQNGNAIDSLGSFSSADFSLADEKLLNVNGPLSATDVSLSANGIDFEGDVTAADLSLESLGSIRQDGGSITAGTLTGTAADNVTLDQSGNEISTLGSFSSADFSLADAELLNLAGPVSATDVSLSASGIDFKGDVTAADLSLESLGGITQDSGTITAGTLTGTAADNVALDQGSNEITTLGSFSSADFSLADAELLNVAGPLSATDVSLSANGIDFEGDVSAGTLALASLGSIRQDGGAINAGTLTGTAADNVTLDQGGNEIDTLGSFTSADFSLSDAQALNVAGPLSATDISLNAALIDFEGDVAAANLSVASLGDITQNGGTITAGTLTGMAAGNVTLDQSGNEISAVRSFTSAGFSLVDAETLNIAGPLQAGVVSLSAPLIDFEGDVVAGDLNLVSSGSIRQDGGTINAATLTGTAVDNVTLDLSGNDISTLGSFTSTGFDLADAAALNITGPLTATTINLNAAAINFGGDVTATNIALASAGDISQSQSDIKAAVLTGTASGNVTLQAAGNSIAALQNFTAGNFSLVDTGQLTVSAGLQANNISLTSGAIDLAGNVNATSQLALGSAGTITQTGGTLNAPILTSIGKIGGNAILTARNIIGALRSFALQGDLLLNVANGLTIAGPVSVGQAVINAATIDLTGLIQGQSNLTFANSGAGGIVIAGIASAGNGITFDSTGGVTEPGGAVIAPTLSGINAGGDVILTSGNNQISTLSGYSLPGNFFLNDQSALTIGSPINAGNAAISAAAINIDADITTGNLDLVSLGSIRQDAGTISAAALSGTAGGDVALNQAGNMIPVLETLTANGDVAITDAAALNLQGNINTDGNSLSLFTAGPIEQSSGIISTAVLNATAPAIDLPQANQIGALGNIVTGDLSVNGDGGIAGSVQVQNATLVASGGFNLTGSLAVSNNFSISAAGNISQPTGNFYATNAVFRTSQPGDAIILNGNDVIPGTLSFSNAGTIIHSAGDLSAGILTGTAGSLASFTGPTDFGLIGRFVTSDSLFHLVNTGNLILNGPLVANEINISTSGGLLLNGTAGGGLFFTGGEASPVATAPRTGVDSILRAASIVETGTYYLNAGPNSPLYNSPAYLGTSVKNATIFMVTAASPSSPGGNIQLATAPGGLYGPAVNVVLNSGTTGFETGNMDVYHLEILGGKFANLSGSIDGITGQPAAGKASAYPYPSKAYQFNGCTIGSLNCFTLGIEEVPNQNPLDRFDLTHRKRRRLAKNVQLPGIATHDF